MLSSPLLSIFSFWAQRTAVRSMLTRWTSIPLEYLSPTCQFFPYQASIQCLPVTIPVFPPPFFFILRTSIIHLDLLAKLLPFLIVFLMNSVFNGMNTSILILFICILLCTLMISRYHFQALSPPHCLYSLCYENEFSPVSQDVELSIAEDGFLQALVIYVNYSLLKNQSILIDTFKDGMKSGVHP